ncbi:sialidase-4-like [Morone saxatilis]|uniref:sialidase-4-like n=1 Tax=Morone saxatilis TaxID=34816 RepID=UPI0015E1CD98|nr:sialidase-4-like [Morone saxatilis]
MGNKPSSHQQQERKRTVFYSKEKEVYRIPALFYDNDKQIFMAFAEQRRTEDDSNAKNLVMKTGTLKIEESSGWSELKLVKEAHLHGYRPMNPCPVYEKRSKKLFLFFISVEGTVSECCQRFWGCNKARLCYVTTTDAGQSWSSVTDLTNKLGEIKNWSTFAVGPGHGLQTESGRLIVPTYAYTSCHDSCLSCDKKCCKSNAPYALSLHSDDSGQTWHFGKMLQNESIECEMAEFFDDKNKSFIYCNARRRGGHRKEAVSKNTGQEFSKPSSAEKLVETGSGCQGSVVSFPAQNEGADGDQSQNKNKWLLFTHPSDESRRIDLGVYLNKSPGDPKAWSKPWIINRGPSGYSDLAYIGDGWFACLMECGEKKETEQIACVVFSYNEVKQGIGE